MAPSQIVGLQRARNPARLTSVEGGRQAVIALTDEAKPETALALLRAGALDSIGRDEADSRTLARAIRYAKGRRGFVIELLLEGGIEAHLRGTEHVL